MTERTHRTDIEASAPPGPARRGRVQRALLVGRSDDPLEREADRVADEVLTVLAASRAPEHSPSATSGRVQRAVGAPPVGEDGGAVDPATTARIGRSTGVPLPPAVRERMEPAFGADFSGTRVHAGPDAADLCQSLSARAFTLGPDIFFGAGEYRPTAAGGEHLLAHELAHTVQQGSAARRATIQRARTKDRDSRRDTSRDERRSERNKGKVKDQRRRAHDAKGDEADYPFGRLAVHEGRRERAEERSAERAAAREAQERDDELMAHVQESAREEAADRNQLLEVDLPDQWAADIAPRIATATGDLAALAPTLEQARTVAQELVRHAVPDPGGQVATHAATIDRLRNEVATSRQACATTTGQVAMFHRLSSGRRFEIGRWIEALEARVAGITAERNVATAYLGPLHAGSLADINTAKGLPNLGLTVPAITGPHGGASRYGGAALTRMNGLIAGATVAGWVPTPWPGPRNAVRPVGPVPYLLPQIDVVVNHVPAAVSATGTATLRLGPEILVDWLFANAAHGLAYRDLKQRAEMVLDTTNRNYAMFQPSLVRSGANWKVECRNYGFQLILNGAKDMIITYYNNL